jgi:hypothetical protein
MNGGMEVNSNWFAIGDQTSTWQSSSHKYSGDYSRAFFTDQASLATFKIFTNSIHVGSDNLGLPFKSKFCVSEDQDLIFYEQNSKMIHVCEGLSTNIKNSFSYPDSLYLGAIACYEGNLYLACYSNYNAFGDSSTRVLKMNGISGTISQVASHQYSGIRALCFDNSGSMIFAHEGWFYYWSYSWRYGISKTVFGQYNPNIFFLYSDFSPIRGLHRSLDNNLFALLSDYKILKLANVSTVVYETHDYNSVFSGTMNEIACLGFTQTFSTVIIGEFNALAPTSERCACIHGFPCWSTTHDKSIKYSYLRHSGLPVTPNSSFTIDAYIQKEFGNSLKINVRRGDGAGYHYQSNMLNLQINEWTQFSDVFTATIADSSAKFEIMHYGQSSAQIYVDECRLGLIENYAYLGVVEVYPEWEMKRAKRKLSSEHRMKTGSLYKYHWGDFDRWDMPLRHVPASVAGLINSWWRTADLVVLKIESGGVWETNSVAVVNKDAPFRRYEVHYPNQMQGVLELESY